MSFPCQCLCQTRSKLEKQSVSLTLIASVSPMPHQRLAFKLLAFLSTMPVLSIAEIRDENPEAEDATLHPTPASANAGPSKPTPATGGTSTLSALPPAGEPSSAATAAGHSHTMMIDGTEMDVDDLPALTTSTNPLYPGAIVKRTGHSHAGGRGSASGRASDAHGSPVLQTTGLSNGLEVSGGAAAETEGNGVEGKRREPRASMSRTGQAVSLYSIHFFKWLAICACRTHCSQQTLERGRLSLACHSLRSDSWPHRVQQTTNALF